jgi:2'-hydroxyisoflavone reductase
MRILVIGGTEFVGRHFVAQALDEGHQHTLFNRGVTHRSQFPEVERRGRTPDRPARLVS